MQTIFIIGIDGSGTDLIQNILNTKHEVFIQGSSNGFWTSQYEAFKKHQYAKLLWSEQGNWKYFNRSTDQKLLAYQHDLMLKMFIGHSSVEFTHVGMHEISFPETKPELNGYLSFLDDVTLKTAKFIFVHRDTSSIIEGDNGWTESDREHIDRVQDLIVDQYTEFIDRADIFYTNNIFDVYDQIFQYVGLENWSDKDVLDIIQEYK